MAEEMTYNQALQELTRFENVWRAASMLKEALQVAARTEGEIKRLQAEEERLRDVVNRAHSVKSKQLQEIKDEVDKAQADSAAELQHLKALTEKSSQEYAATMARRDQDAQNAIRRLEEAVAAKREEVNDTFAALNKEIVDKQALVTELNGQLDNLRKRLG